MNHGDGSERTNPRVAILYPVPFGDNGIFGGGERYAFELAKALARRTPTRLVTFGPRASRETFDGLEVRIRRPLKYLSGHKSNPLAFGQLLDLQDVDVIHCVRWNTFVTDMAILYAKATGKKVFITDIGGGSSLTLTRLLPLGRLVDGFLLIAEQGGRQFEEFRSKWHIIHAGIDTDRFKPRADAMREGVLFVGRLLPHKGINYLIEAMDAHTPLTVVGRPYHPEYWRLLQELSAGKNVRFITDASDEELVRRYQSCAIKVFPSVYDTIYGHHTDLPELLGFTAMEAMSCAMPVIASDVGGLSEVLADGVTGFLIPPNDAPAIREKLRLLFGTPELLARLGEAGRQRILERFTWDAVARKCLDAYSQ